MTINFICWLYLKLACLTKSHFRKSKITVKYRSMKYCMVEFSQNMLFLENRVLNLRNVSETEMWAKWFLRKSSLESDTKTVWTINREHYDGRWDLHTGRQEWGCLTVIMLLMMWSAEMTDPLSLCNLNALGSGHWGHTHVHTHTCKTGHGCHRTWMEINAVSAWGFHRGCVIGVND